MKDKKEYLLKILNDIISEWNFNIQLITGKQGLIKLEYKRGVDINHCIHIGASIKNDKEELFKKIMISYKAEDKEDLEVLVLEHLLKECIKSGIDKELRIRKTGQFERNIDGTGKYYPATIHVDKGNGNIKISNY